MTHVVAPEHYCSSDMWTCIDCGRTRSSRVDAAAGECDVR